jgi:uncharacterized protein (DUF1499 family)
MQYRFYLYLQCVALAAQALSTRTNKIPMDMISRRGLLQNVILQTTPLLATMTYPAVAFENRISNQYDDRPKQRGSMPSDLGIRMRKDMVGEPYLGLKPCGTAPNCFVSTDPDSDIDPEHYIPAWKWPSSIKSFVEAIDDIEKLVLSYPPGQQNIDGGGFKIMTRKPDYLYVHFESLKNGFIDDVEFAYLENADGSIQIRSSSRLGYLDFGVNAKRLNWIADALRQRGWDAEGVSYKTHPEYVYQNRLS